MKTILLAISGSIAFYKAYELISMLKKEGFKVKVLLSNGVLKFVSPLSFEALAHSVLHEDNESWQNEQNHIKFSQDCDALLLAPASINSINKLANGIADTLFLQTIIAAKAPLIIAPAANTNMINHFSTQNSLKILEKNGVKIISPVCKKLACNDEGMGALADIDTIFYELKKTLLKDEFFVGKTAVITGGGTRERIDDVRCISNFSSGKMAKAIADAFYCLGAKVIFLSSVDFKTPYALHKFESSKELDELLNENLGADFLIMAAAVSDFVPEFKSGKIKKNEHVNGLSLSLKLNKDLLKECKFKGKKIGFKMEFDAKNALQNAKNALSEKKLDMLCLNLIDEKNAFGSDLNQITFIRQDKSIQSKLESKENLGFELTKLCKDL